MYKTYYQLKRLNAQELFNYALIEGVLSNRDKEYFRERPCKSTLLEILSVTHREWFKKPFINGNRQLITN